MMRFLLALATLSFLPLAHAGLPPVRTVPHVDLSRYMGRWYEIATILQDFQRGCTASTADYSLRDDGKVDVLNQCRLGYPTGPLKSARAVAFPADATNGRLKVRFPGRPLGDYWILELGRNYEYAVVGTPDRGALWVLSRSPEMRRLTYLGILDRLRAKYFDVSRLRVTGRLVIQP